MEKFKQLKKWVIELVIWAETEFKDKTGKEKRAIVTAKLDDMLKLPWWLEWADGPLIGCLVDLACEKLNWLTDKNFSYLTLTPSQINKLATVMTAPLNAIQQTAATVINKTVDDKLNDIYKSYLIKSKQGS